MIPGCRIGAGSVVEPGAIVCDGSVLGAGCVVRAGAVVKQRSRFAAGSDVSGLPVTPPGTSEPPPSAPRSAVAGFPAIDVGRIPAPPPVPTWALRRDDLPVPTPTGPAK